MKPDINIAKARAEIDVAKIREVFPELWGKHGVKLDNGLIPVRMDDGSVEVVFASACYDADGKVFVEKELVDQGGEVHDSWGREAPEDAERLGLKVVLCSFPGCGKPAVRLDHHHGYMDDMTNCEEHINWVFKPENADLRGDCPEKAK